MNLKRLKEYELESEDNDLLVRLLLVTQSDTVGYDCKTQPRARKA